MQTHGSDSDDSDFFGSDEVDCFGNDFSEADSDSKNEGPQPPWATIRGNACPTGACMSTNRGNACPTCLRQDSTVNDAAASFEEWFGKGLDCINEEKCKRLKATLETQVVPAADLQSLKALTTLAGERFVNFKSVISTNRPLCPDRTITIGSACTGSNADLAFAIAVALTLKQLHP